MMNEEEHKREEIKPGQVYRAYMKGWQYTSHDVIPLWREVANRAPRPVWRVLMKTGELLLVHEHNLLYSV